MRLPFSERRRLRRIGKAIGRSDPRLASLLGMFSKLAAEDAMPCHETLHARHGAARPIMTRQTSQPGLPWVP
jgi:hypothetical protein